MSGSLTDFNDLHVAAGLDVVRAQLEKVLPADASSFTVADEIPEGDSPHWGLAPEPDLHDGWERLLCRNDKGNLVAHANNVITILRHHDALRGLLGYNEFSMRIEKLRAPAFGGGAGEWTDSDDLNLMYWLGQKMSLNVKDEACAKAAKKVADDKSFHPVRDYLESLSWDGWPRVERWLSTYLGAECNDYTMAVGKKWLIAAVARVMLPACKVDTVLILYGKQGRGKSTALRVLGGDWFMDTPIPIGQKDAYEAIRGRWIVELGELDSLNKAENTAAKVFFSSESDTYRPSYGRHSIRAARQCVFAGTTNHFVHLKDPSGNRRYWSVCSEKIDIAGLRADRDQLWAEALHLFRANEPWWELMDEHELFDAAQEQHRLSDPWESIIQDWLDEPKQFAERDFKSERILTDCLLVPLERITAQMQSRVVTILERMGFTRCRPRSGPNGKRGSYVYRKPSASVDGGKEPL